MKSNKYIMTELAAKRALQRYLESADVGERLRYFREQAGLSQDELALYAGVSQATISRIEHGRRAMRPHEHAAISRGLGVSHTALAASTRKAAA